MPLRVKNAKVRPSGCFGHQPVFGFVEPDPGFAFDGKRWMGLTLTDHFIYGGLRSVDGQRYFSFYRHFNNQGALGFSVFEATLEEGGLFSDFAFERQSTKAYLGAALTNQQDGIWGVRDMFDGDPRFEVRAWPEGAHWLEKGLVDLTCEATGSVKQICNPDAETPTLYNSRCVRARGSFLGHEVEGWLQMDNAFLPDGLCWFNSKYHHNIQAGSTNFITQYDDGNFDQGMLICGLDGYNAFCVESSNHEPLVVAAPDFDIELDAHEYPIRVSVDVGEGEYWDWQRLPGGKAKVPSTTVNNAPRWIQGVFTRRGETRMVTSADGWLETYKHSLDQR